MEIKFTVIFFILIIFSLGCHPIEGGCAGGD